MQAERDHERHRAREQPGGFGSIPGALVAGLLIGVIESLSAYLIGAVYKDIVVYSLFLFFLWFRPQGLMGKM